MPSIDNSNNTINSLIMTEQGSTPTTPPTGKWRVFTKSDGLYIVDDAGAVTGPFGSGGGGAPTDADYVVETANAGLSAESVLGTTVITTAAYASRQAAAKAGRLFLPSDGISIQRDTGAAWAPWGPIYPLTLPAAAASWTGVHNGAANATDTKGGIYLYSNSSGDTPDALVVSTPATPWTVDAWVLIRIWAANYNSAGLIFRQSSDGKLATFGYKVGNVWTLDKYTSSAFVAAYATYGIPSIPTPVCMRIQDTGVNRVCSYSLDGQNFVQVHSVGRTDYLTADQMGFYAVATNATYYPAITLLSWKVT